MWLSPAEKPGTGTGIQNRRIGTQQLREVLHTGMAAMKEDILALVGSS